jgi:GNAT superfamily N-acetyltransferase
MDVTTLPLTPERWGDLEAVFLAKGCSMARGCWCMYYRESGRVRPPEGVSVAEDRRRRLRELASAEPPAGLIAYHGDAPVGWVAVSERSNYPRLARSPVAKPIDDLPVWSVVCFVVPSAYRGRGVARALLRGALAHAEAHGAVALEGYPVDRPGRGQAGMLWSGVRTMFEREGFVEVARRRPERPVMRRALGGQGQRGNSGGGGAT